MMVKSKDSRYIYGDIKGKVTNDITKIGIIEYIMGKNSHWTEEVFNIVDWVGIGVYMGKIKETRLTNVLTLVHGWQNDKQQKELFNENNEEYECPVECKKMETRLHCIRYTAGDLQEGHMKRRMKFSKVHNILRTAKVIYNVFLRIMRFLRNGRIPPVLISNFDLELDRMVMAV